jgi:hypothetical protein
MANHIPRNVTTTNPTGNVVCEDISDGVVSLNGLSTFAFTSMASNSNRSVTIIGDDGFTNQAYTMSFSTPIINGEFFTLRNGAKSITFINNRGPISSAYGLSSHLQNNYPVRFLITRNTSLESSSSSSSIYEKYEFPTEDLLLKANSALDGVQGMSGLTSFKVTTAAMDYGNTVTIIGNDGGPGASYSIDVTAFIPIVPDAAFTLTNISNGNSITFVNNCGSKIKNTNGLSAYLQIVYPPGTVLSADIYSKTQALQNVIGTPTDSRTDSLITCLGIPIQTGNQSSIAKIIGGVQSSGVTLSTLLGDPGKGNIIGNIGGSTNSISDGLKVLGAGLCGDSSLDTSLIAQVDMISTSILKAPSRIISSDMATLRSLLVINQGKTAQEDIEHLTSLVNAPTATNSNGVLVNAALLKFTNATNLEGQIQAFVELFNNPNWTNTSATQLTIDISAGAPKSLADIVNRMFSLK